MKVYLDNCAFNRPFDDQSHIRIRLETEAKLYIQDHIKKHNIELVWSYMLDIENDHNPFEEKRRAIEKWKRLAAIDVEENESLIEKANDLFKTGINAKDALHVSAAMEGKADYFITTDDKLLRKLSSNCEIQVINPVDIVGEIDEHHN
jgi:predicted nucleic acid-binding protein